MHAVEADVGELREVAGVQSGSSPIWQEANAFQRRAMLQRGSMLLHVRAPQLPTATRQLHNCTN